MEQNNIFVNESSKQPETVKLWVRIGCTVKVPYEVYEQLQNEEGASEVMLSILKGEVGETYLDGETYFPDVEENMELSEVDFDFYEPQSRITFSAATPEIHSFYYTFGTSSQFPFKRGWVEVQAPYREDADRLFRQRYPDVNEGYLNCSSVYTKEQFGKIWEKNYKDAPDWNICHAVITGDQPEKTVTEKEPLDTKIQSAQNRTSSGATGIGREPESEHDR